MEKLNRGGMVEKLEKKPLVDKTPSRISQAINREATMRAADLDIAGAKYDQLAKMNILRIESGQPVKLLLLPKD